MADVSNHIKKLNTQLQLLLKQYNNIFTDNTQQRKTIEKLEQIVKQQNDELLKVKQEQLILKASLDTMDETEKKKFEQKINGYIRNIDKCISLLGHKQIV